MIRILIASTLYVLTKKITLQQNILPPDGCAVKKNHRQKGKKSLRKSHRFLLGRF
jgi:hypothetical protein